VVVKPDICVASSAERLVALKTPIWVVVNAAIWVDAVRADGKHFDPSEGFKVK
jgi:hypothetical protein